MSSMPCPIFLPPSNLVCSSIWQLSDKRRQVLYFVSLFTTTEQSRSFWISGFAIGQTAEYSSCAMNDFHHWHQIFAQILIQFNLLFSFSSSFSFYSVKETVAANVQPEIATDHWLLEKVNRDENGDSVQRITKGWSLKKKH